MAHAPLLLFDPVGDRTARHLGALTSLGVPTWTAAGSLDALALLSLKRIRRVVLFMPSNGDSLHHIVTLLRRPLEHGLRLLLAAEQATDLVRVRVDALVEIPVVTAPTSEDLARFASDPPDIGWEMRLVHLSVLEQRICMHTDPQ